MSTSAAIVLVAAMIFAVPLLAIWTRRPRRERGSPEQDEVVEALEVEVLALRERVQNLEAIVTDDRYVLESEFEELETASRAPSRREHVRV